MRALTSRALDIWEAVPGKSKYRAECASVLNRPNCANVSDDYSAAIESLNIQPIVRLLTGVKPSIPRMTLNRLDLALNGHSLDIDELQDSFG